MQRAPVCWWHRGESLSSLSSGTYLSLIPCTTFLSFSHTASLMRMCSQSISHEDCVNILNRCGDVRCAKGVNHSSPVGGICIKDHTRLFSDHSPPGLSKSDVFHRRCFPSSRGMGECRV